MDAETRGVVVDAVAGFDQDEGEDPEMLGLYALVQSLDWMDLAGDIPAQLGELFDLERYLAMAATEIAIGHWDGYAWTRNNYYIYQPTSESPWSFMPWGPCRFVSFPTASAVGRAVSRQVVA